MEKHIGTSRGIKFKKKCELLLPMWRWRWLLWKERKTLPKESTKKPTQMKNLSITTHLNVRNGKRASLKYRGILLLYLLFTGFSFIPRPSCLTYQTHWYSLAVIFLAFVFYLCLAFSSFIRVLNFVSLDEKKKKKHPRVKWAFHGHSLNFYSPSPSVYRWCWLILKINKPFKNWSVYVTEMRPDSDA